LGTVPSVWEKLRKDCFVFGTEEENRNDYSAHQTVQVL
jgi:hypothetical protein